MSPAIAIKYDAPETLSRFLDSDKFVRVIVGPVGSGKSSACVIEVLRRAVEQAPSPDGIRRTRFAVIRNTYPELRDTTAKTFEQWCPADLGKWNVQEFSFTMKFRDVECEVLFRALDRPEDIKKLLSLELTGAYINELREIPKRIFDVLQTRVGRYPSKLQGGATWFGVWADTNPWHVSHWGFKLFSEGEAAANSDFELFEQPGGREPNAENIENLPDKYYERLCQGKDEEWIEEYVDSKYPESVTGSVYGRLIASLKQRGGYTDFEHPNDGVYLSVDLGISDAFSMWWWRFSKGVDFIDHYEASGEPLSHYFDEIEKRPYSLIKIWLPHDARARSLQTGMSTQDKFMEAYPNLCAIGPELSVADGIGAGRWLLEQPHTRIHTRCSSVNGETDIDGVEALKSYRYEWDEVRQTFKKTPLHDWASHTSDAFRYAALVAKYAKLRANPKPEPERIIQKPPTTTEEIFKAHFESAGRRKRAR